MAWGAPDDWELGHRTRLLVSAVPNNWVRRVPALYAWDGLLQSQTLDYLDRVGSCSTVLVVSMKLLTVCW